MMLAPGGRCQYSCLTEGQRCHSVEGASSRSYRPWRRDSGAPALDHTPQFYNLHYAHVQPTRACSEPLNLCIFIQYPWLIPNKRRLPSSSLWLIYTVNHRSFSLSTYDKHNDILYGQNKVISLILWAILGGLKIKFDYNLFKHFREICNVILPWSSGTLKEESCNHLKENPLRI